jgi:heat shock protein HslJ
VAVVVCAALLAGCGRSAPVVQPTPSPTGQAWPKGHTFTSTKVTDGGRDRPLVAGTRISVSLRDPGEVSVQAGCNELSVLGRLDGDRIMPTSLAATAKGCAPELQAQDSWIQHFFGDGPAWRLAGPLLTLTDGTTEVRLADDADRPLLGTRWVVVQRVSGAGAKDVPPGIAYLVFGRNGLVGATGCSGLAATIQLRDGSFTVEPAIRSDQPCDGEIAELDAAVTATLTGVVQYRIKGTELVLTGPGGNGLTLRAQDEPAETTAGPSPATSSSPETMDGPGMMGGAMG